MVDKDIQKCSRKQILKFVYPLLFGCLVFFSFRLSQYHVRLIFNPYPLEYREGVFPFITEFMIKGGNPYDLDNQPLYNNDYGVFYNLISCPFAKWFSPTLTLHRFISAFFIWSICGLIFFVLWRQKTKLFYACCAVLILYASLLFFVTPLARPDSLGLFLFLLSIVIPELNRYAHRSLAASIFMGLLAFYSKPYFGFSLFFLALYIFLYISKKKGLIYFMSALVSFLVSLILINIFYECYLNNVLLKPFVLAQKFFLGQSYANEQAVKYLIDNAGLVVLCLVGFLVWFVRMLKKTSTKILFIPSMRMSWCSNIDINNFDRPLMINRAPIYHFFLVIMVLLVYLRMGQHGGQWLSYFFHLISPFLILVVMDIIQKQDMRPMIVIPLLLLNLYTMSFKCLPMKYLSYLNGDPKSWQALYSLVSQKHKIFNTPLVVPLLMQQGKEIVDSGQSEYFIDSAYRAPFLNFIFPHPRQIIEIDNLYMLEILKCVKDRQFDLIILTTHKDIVVPVLSEALVGSYYNYKGTIEIQMPHAFQSWELHVWEPKEEKEAYGKKADMPRDLLDSEARGVNKS